MGLALRLASTIMLVLCHASLALAQNSIFDPIQLFGSLNLVSAGDLPYYNGTTLAKLSRGADGTCLKSTTSTIGWSSCVGSVNLATQVIGTLGVAFGGTGRSTWTGSRCVETNALGTELQTAAGPCGSGGSGDNLEANGTALSDANFNNSLPAPPSGSLNVSWQSDTATPNRISAYVPVTSPLGISGGSITLTDVVPPSLGGLGVANAATLGRYLRADGTNFVTSSIAAGGVGTCTNQFVRAINDNAAPTCGTVVPADFASQSANLVLAAPNGSAGAPSFRALVDADIPDTITVSVAATASALSSNGANCTGNNFAVGVDAAGVAECAQPSFANLSGAATDAQIPNTITIDNLTQITTRSISDTTGTLGVTRGGTGLTAIAVDRTLVATAADTLTATALPSCSNATTSKLLYDTATHTFSCGTDQSGGGGGGLDQAAVLSRVSLGF